MVGALGRRCWWCSPARARRCGGVRAARGLLGLLALSALLIVSGWSVYVWAVNNGHNIESSLGYYINPLLNMAVGACCSASGSTGSAWPPSPWRRSAWRCRALALGHLPLISLFLAVTFAIYGVIRKRVDVGRPGRACSSSAC